MVRKDKLLQPHEYHRSPQLRFEATINNKQRRPRKRKRSKWAQLTTTTPKLPKFTTRFVAIDLGNVHDIMLPLQKYVASGCVVAKGFADKEYNGFGVNPKSSIISVHQSQSKWKNSADVALLWHVSQMVQTFSAQDRSLHVIIATRDKGFRSVSEHINSKTNMSCVFVKNWAELKQVIKL